MEIHKKQLDSLEERRKNERLTLVIREMTDWLMSDIISRSVPLIWGWKSNINTCLVSQPRGGLSAQKNYASPHLWPQNSKGEDEWAA
jgi:hypothetical protein